jgi:hypothetical protein
MKKLLLICLSIFVMDSLIAQNVGINTTGAIPNASAGLDVNFTTKGLLIPRVALTATNAAAPITTPATSLLVYNTATVGGANAVSPGFYYWDGAQWLRFGTTTFTDTDDQTLSTNGDSLFIADGNFVILPQQVVTLDSAYDEGGAGMGRMIFADAGAVLVQGTDGLQVIGTHGTGATLAIPDSTSMMFFYPRKSAFRAGGQTNTYWEDDSIGVYSFASGLNTKAKGAYSTAAGFNQNVTGTAGTALGVGHNVPGFVGTALGGGNTASGNWSTATGINTAAEGQGSFSGGEADTAHGDHSTVFGRNNYAEGANSTALGMNAHAKSYMETTVGRFNDTSGNTSTTGWVGTDRLFSVGNGTSGAVRNNALTVYKDGKLEIAGLVGTGNRMVVANANGVLGTQAITLGDITSVTAGAGLSGGGAIGAITMTAEADNGLNVNAGADRIRLGGPLVENTTITNGAFGMIYNLNGTGDFLIQDLGVNRFAVLDNGRTTVGGVNNAGRFNVTGNSYFSDDLFLRDGAVNAGDFLVRIYDSADDGIVDVYEDGGVNHRIHGNGVTVFNEQGNNNADLRIESDLNANMFFMDAGLNRVGIGDNTPAATLDVNGNLRLGVGTTNAPNYELVIEDATNPAMTIGNTAYNEVNSGLLVFNEDPGAQITAGTFCGFQFRHDGLANNLYLETGCTGPITMMTFERSGDIGIQLANPTYDLHLGFNSAAKPGTTTWTVASDSLLKEDVSDFKDGLSTLRGIHPVYFKYNGKAGINDSNYYVGVLAQQLERVAPYMVGSFEAEDSGKQKEVYKSVDNGAMTYVTINAIKELDDKQKKLATRTQNVSDFGVEVSNSRKVFVPFSNNFKDLISTVPVVTVTAVGSNVTITIISQTKEGFTVEIDSDTPVTFNWIAMSKAKTEDSQVEYTEAERKEMLKKVQVTKAGSEHGEIMYDDAK